MMNFGQALEHLKKGDESSNSTVTRKNWYGSDASPMVKLQKPDENSKMTAPYLYMEKRQRGSEGMIRFPLDLSCESILAEDWIIIN